MTDSSLTSRTARALKWSFSVGAFTAGIRFSTTAIIAHYLDPPIFGVFNMSMVVIQSIQVFSNLGVNAAIIQKSDFDDLDLSTAFCTNLISAFMAFAIAYILSFPSALFFDNELVTPVIITLSCIFLIPIMAGMNGVLLRKNLRYARLQFADFSASLIQCSVLLICVVQFKMGIWSMVLGLISWFLVESITQRLMGSWAPKIKFDLGRFKSLFSIGRNMLGSNILTYLARNLDFVIVGHNLGSHALGLYQMAYNLPHIIHTQIAAPAAGVLMPAMCETHGDVKRMKTGLLRAFRLVALVVFPFAVGLALVSDNFITTIYGQNWLGAVNPLRILCACALIRSFTSIVMSPLLAKERTDFLLKWNLFTILISFPLLVGGSFFGISGVASGMLISTCVDFFFYKFVLSMMDIPLSDLFHAIKPVAGACLIMSAAVLLSGKGLEAFPPSFFGERLVAGILSGVLSYALAVWFLFPGLRRDALRAFSQSLSR
jgi:O-antigen/teichoic acid export membrane protein